MALPLHVILGLRISRRDKISTACLFGVGSIAIIVSFIRVFSIWAKTGSTTPSPAWLGLWAVIECMVAIICGCIPALSQIFRSSRAPSPAYNSHYPYERRVPDDGGIWSGSEGDRGRGPQIISTPERAFTSSEEYLHPKYDRIQAKTEIVSTATSWHILHPANMRTQVVKRDRFEHDVDLPIMEPDVR